MPAPPAKSSANVAGEMGALPGHGDDRDDVLGHAERLATAPGSDAPLWLIAIGVVLISGTGIVHVATGADQLLPGEFVALVAAGVVLVLVASAINLAHVRLRRDALERLEALARVAAARPRQ